MNKDIQSEEVKELLEEIRQRKEQRLAEEMKEFNETLDKEIAARRDEAVSLWEKIHLREEQRKEGNMNREIKEAQERVAEEIRAKYRKSNPNSEWAGNDADRALRQLVKKLQK